MSIVQEFRARGVAPPPKDKWFVTLAVGVVVAFGLGAAGTLAWQGLGSEPGAQAPSTLAAPVPAAPKPPATIQHGGRLGSARASPLLARCMKQELSGFLDLSGFDAQGAYEFLRGASGAVRTAGMMRIVMGNRTPDAGTGGEMTPFLGPVVDCIMSRDDALCEPDNRALAVEFLGDYLPQAELVPIRPPHERRHGEFGDHARILPRVKAALADHARSGRLVPSDFGLLASPAIKTILQANPPTRDACRRA